MLVARTPRVHSPRVATLHTPSALAAPHRGCRATTRRYPWRGSDVACSCFASCALAGRKLAHRLQWTVTCHRKKPFSWWPRSRPSCGVRSCDVCRKTTRQKNKKKNKKEIQHAPGGVRTLDRQLIRLSLYQLSYKSMGARCVDGARRIQYILSLSALRAPAQLKRKIGHRRAP